MLVALLAAVNLSQAYVSDVVRRIKALRWATSWAERKAHAVRANEAGSGKQGNGPNVGPGTGRGPDLHGDNGLRRLITLH